MECRPLRGGGGGIGAARILIGGGPKVQITCDDVIRNFQKRNFLWDKDIAKWKIRSIHLVLALNQDLAKGRGLIPNV